jgi:tetratricopeptide (TPR) repeat protein
MTLFCDRLLLDPDPVLEQLELNLAQTHGTSTTLLQSCQQLQLYGEHLQAAKLLQQAISQDTPAPELRLAQADCLQQSGLKAQALGPLRQLGRWPEHRCTALQREAELRVLMGQPEQAWQLYNNLTSEGFALTQAIACQAELAFGHSAPSQLRDSILHALAQHPSLERHLSLYRAWQMEFHGDEHRAQALYLEHLWDHPDDGQAMVRLARLMDGQTLLQSLTGQRFLEQASSNCLLGSVRAIDQIRSLHWQGLPEYSERLMHSAPQSADLSHWISKLAWSLGQQEQAQRYAQQAITLSPGDLSLLRSSLEQFWLTGHDQPSLLTTLQRHQASDADLNYSGQLLLTMLQLEQGQIEAAAASCAKICQQHPWLSRPWVLQAEILRRCSRPKAALAQLRHCPAVAATEDVALEESIAMLDLGQHREALRSLDQLHLLRTSLKALNSRALCLYLLEEIDPCESYLRQSLRRHHHNPDAWNQRAILARERGDYWRAMRYLRSALRLNPNHAPAHYNLSQLHRYTTRSKHLKELEQQLSRHNLTCQERINLLYALAKARENCNEHKTALGLYLSASKLKISSLEDFNLQDHVQFLLNRNQCFRLKMLENPAATAATTASNTTTEPTPIFIVGLPRSGSTLAEQILGNLRTCYRLGESKLFSEALEAAGISLHTPPAGDLSSHQRQQARHYYYAHLPQAAINGQWITDKMLYNYTYIDLIQRIFPEARIIAMQRQPLDMFLSMLKCNFSEGNLWTFSLDAMLDVYDSYQKLINTAQLHRPRRLAVLQYENLATNPEATLRELTGHLELPWSSDYLQHQQQPNSIRTASDMRARQAIDHRSIHTWKQHASELDGIRSKLLALGHGPATAN